ncbi:hypothetical protein AB1Y20_008067 [Prymnesium parvum]|uniref:SURP motif domain-containing protein n=1 Tax=Prymnesium parvum TaxID=97485 RepID=A0AB34ITC0_PRYPA
MAALGLSAEEIAAVEKMADYKVRNGDQFEALIKQKQQGNPKFAFLFDVASPAHAYYQQRFLQLKAQQHAPQLQQHAPSPRAPPAAGFGPPLGAGGHFAPAGYPQVMAHAPPLQMAQMAQMAHMQQMQQMQMMHAQPPQPPIPPMPPMLPSPAAAAPSALSPEELARERAAALAQRLQLAPEVHPPAPMPAHLAALQAQAAQIAPPRPPAAPPVLSAHSIPVGALATLLQQREVRDKFEPLQQPELPRGLPAREAPSAEVLAAIDEYYKGGKPPRPSRRRRRRSASPRRERRGGASMESDGYERTSSHLAHAEMGVREDGSAVGGMGAGRVGLGGHQMSAADQFAEFRGRRSNNYKESMAISKANQYNNWYNVGS